MSCPEIYKATCEYGRGAAAVLLPRPAKGDRHRHRMRRRVHRIKKTSPNLSMTLLPACVLDKSAIPRGRGAIICAEKFGPT